MTRIGGIGKNGRICGIGAAGWGISALSEIPEQRILLTPWGVCDFGGPEDTSEDTFGKH